MDKVAKVEAVMIMFIGLIAMVFVVPHDGSTSPKEGVASTQVCSGVHSDQRHQDNECGRDGHQEG